MVESGLIKSRVLILVKTHTLGDYNAGLRYHKLWVKAGSPGILYTVYRPLAALRDEAGVKEGMEIPGKEKEGILFSRCLDPGSYGWNNCISFWNGQGSARAEIVLDIHNNQGIMRRNQMI